MDERLCVNPGHGCFHTWLVGHGRREMESKARMPPWQLVPEPLNHTLTLQSCSQTEKSRRLVEKQRTRRAGCRERMWEICPGWGTRVCFAVPLDPFDTRHRRQSLRSCAFAVDLTVPSFYQKHLQLPSSYSVRILKLRNQSFYFQTKAETYEASF